MDPAQKEVTSDEEPGSSFECSYIAVVAPQKRKINLGDTIRYSFVIVTLVSLLILGLKAFFSLSYSFFIYNDDPKTQVLVNGNAVTFDHGSYMVSPWWSTYEVEIRNSKGVQRRLIYPFDPESDSGSISIEKGKVTFGIESKVLE